MAPDPEDPVAKAKAERQSAAERLRIAEAYREKRTKELNATAAAAVGGPVEVAARFATTATGNIAMSMPFVGMLLASTRRLGVPKPLRGLEMLALDDATLYGIASPKRVEQGEGSVVISWPREEVRVVSLVPAGTDTGVIFEAPGELPRFRLYCSSLRTNPWASELVRALGGEPPEPIDPAKLAYDSTDLPTV